MAKKEGTIGFTYNAKLTPNARSLRKALTPWERKLWYNYLRTYPVKFYRQRPAANYILDFYSPSIKLAVELDGSQHYTDAGESYDRDRTALLQSLGITVLRFTNTQIDRQFAAVAAAIDAAVQQKNAPTQ